MKKIFIFFTFLLLCLTFIAVPRMSLSADWTDFYEYSYSGYLELPKWYFYETEQEYINNYQYIADSCFDLDGDGIYYYAPNDTEVSGLFNQPITLSGSYLNTLLSGNPFNASRNYTFTSFFNIYADIYYSGEWGFTKTDYVQVNYNDIVVDIPIVLFLSGNEGGEDSSYDLLNGFNGKLIVNNIYESTLDNVLLLNITNSIKGVPERSDAENFMSLFDAVFKLPIQYIENILNLNIFGVALISALATILTIVLIVYIIKKV